MAGWHVWGALRRRAHIDLMWGHLGTQKGRIDDMPNGRRQITLDVDLSPVERRAVLAHELVHDERGILFLPSTPTALVEKEEAYVRDETARRLVPADLLDDFVTWRLDDGRPVMWRDIAEEFEVPRDVAERAVEMSLQRGSRSRHPTAR